jgi:GNAT superfamily N-acetyltransferase
VGIENYVIAREPNVPGAEVCELRASDSTDEIQIRTPEFWDTCVSQSLCVVTARELFADRLVGIGFLVGNFRHAELVDMTVHPDARRNGIGRALQQERLAFAQENDITYVSLTWDTSKPWLHPFYVSNGFRDVDFAMWHEDSLARTTAAASTD